MKPENEPETAVSSSDRELETFRSEVGQRLRRFRKEVSKLSLARFAEEEGAGRSSVERYERGERLPDVWFLARLCSRYKLRADWVLRGTGPMLEQASKTESTQQQGAGTQRQSQGAVAESPDLELLELIVATVKKELADLSLTLPPEAEARVIRLLYQLYRDQDGQPIKETVAEVIRLAAYR